MAVRIERVEKGSPAELCGIRDGGTLLAVNGRPVRDVFDYGFLCADSSLTLDVEYACGPESFCLTKDEYSDVGLVFDTFLMDDSRSCRNNCIFCFIDQLPKGLRETLYFKDDDERLSYLFGNYITLTNLSNEDVERIIEMKISPVNISVHTTDKALRCEMMRNRFAGEKLKYLYRLASAGVEINCQIVLCRGVNDGDKLAATLKDLSELWPSVRSVAVVPVGLTRFRDGLVPLKPFDRASAAEAIDIIEATGSRNLEKTGSRIVYPADEFFVLAGEPVPGCGYYGEMLQLENGVGMLAKFRNEFAGAASRAAGDSKKRSADIVTGTAAADMLNFLVNDVKKKYNNTVVTVHAVKNEFFGETVSVAGLLTGTDVIAQLKGKLLSKRLLIPSSMLRREGDLFLDGLSPADLEEGARCRNIGRSTAGKSCLTP